MCDNCFHGKGRCTSAHTDKAELLLARAEIQRLNKVIEDLAKHSFEMWRDVKSLHKGAEAEPEAEAETEPEAEAEAAVGSCGEQAAAAQEEAEVDQHRRIAYRLLLENGPFQYGWKCELKGSFPLLPVAEVMVQELDEIGYAAGYSCTSAGFFVRIIGYDGKSHNPGVKKAWEILHDSMYFCRGKKSLARLGSSYPDDESFGFAKEILQVAGY